MQSAPSEDWSEWENQNLQRNFPLQMLCLQYQDVLRCRRQSVPGNQAYPCKHRESLFRDNILTVLTLGKMAVLANGSTFFLLTLLVLSHRGTRARMWGLISVTVGTYPLVFSRKIYSTSSTRVFWHFSFHGKGLSLLLYIY